MSNDPRPACPACALKHLAASWAWHELGAAQGLSAMSIPHQTMFCLCKAGLQWNEFLAGYEGHDTLAEGWLAVAEELIRGSDPGWADEIRAVRKNRNLRTKLQGRPVDCRLMALAHLTEAVAEGNMKEDAPDLCLFAVGLSNLYMSDTANMWPSETHRKLLVEYRKLYEL